MTADLPFKPMSTRKRLAISVPLILLGVFIMANGIAYYLFKPCVDNFDQQLPLYPNAEILQDNRNWQQAFGAGTPHLELRTADASREVEFWYLSEIARMAQAYTFEDNAPVEWQGIYQVIPIDDGGSRVILRMFCDRSRL